MIPKGDSLEGAIGQSSDLSAFKLREVNMVPRRVVSYDRTVWVHASDPVHQSIGKAWPLEIHI